MSPSARRGMNDPPHGFRTVTIAGVGLIGGSLALGLRRAGFGGELIGVSSSAAIADALALGAIDRGYGYEDLIGAAALADVVFLCTPIHRILEHIDTLGTNADRLRPGAIVTDVGSTKSEILRRAESSFPETLRFIGGHPLAGSEQRGVGAANAFLFENAYYVLTPSSRSDAAEVDRLGAFIETTGARVVELSADRHDRIAAAISHVPQLLAVALVESLDALGDDGRIAKKLAAGGFRDMTRIASSPFSVWKDILETNRAHVATTLERFTDRLSGEFTPLDSSSLAQRFENAARTRGEIPKDTKGFRSRLWDLLVEVEDKPGMLYGLVKPLFDAGINIKDIEVVKVREDEGGTLRLAFAREDDATRALGILAAGGFQARIRD